MQRYLNQLYLISSILVFMYIGYLMGARHEGLKYPLKHDKAYYEAMKEWSGNKITSQSSHITYLVKELTKTETVCGM